MREFVIDTLEAATNWTVLGNDTENLEAVATAPHVHGTTAVQFDKANGSDNTKLAGIYRSFNSTTPYSTDSATLALDGFDTQAELRWQVSVSSRTNIDYAFVRLGTSGSHYVEFRYYDRDMLEGEFTPCRARLSAFKWQTGNGWNRAAIAYAVVGVAFDGETNTLTDITVQRLEVVEAPEVSATIVNTASDPTTVNNTPAASTSGQVAGIANAAAPTYAEGSQAPISTDLAGGLRTKVDLAQAAKDGTSPADVLQVGAVSTTSAPTYTTAKLNPLSQNTAGQLRARLDSAQTTIDGAAAADVVQAGAKATAAAPTYTEAKMNPLSQTLGGELRARLDLAQGATGADVPAQAVQGGLRAETSTPTAVTNGQLVAPAGTVYGRQKLASFDDSSSSERTTPLSEPPRKTYGPETLSALTAAGSSAARDASEYRNGKWSFVVAALEAGQFCVVRAEAEEDGTNYNNMDAENVDLTITANGNYQLYWSNRQLNNVRFTMVTDSVGGAVTVTPTLSMGS